jgi:Pectate lyase superfamily protein
MRISANLRKLIWLLILSVWVALGAVFILPQLALKFTGSTFSQPAVTASPNITKIDPLAESISPSPVVATSPIKPAPVVTTNPIQPVLVATIASKTPVKKVFPSGFIAADVKTKYGAKGDGVTDDTAAIQAALDDDRSEDQDFFGKPKALYFPAGTYLISNTLTWKGCCMNLQGQGAGVSIIKLKDRANGFGDRNKSKPVIQTIDGNMSFRQNITDLTVDTGKNNPGASGIDYISNNYGSLWNVSIRSGDGQGKVGLDMSRQWAGPCLIKNVQINGFDYGIVTKNLEYGPTFEQITLQQQKVAGILNDGNTLAIRQLQSINSVPAIQNREQVGMIIVVDSNFQGGAANVSAIENNGYLYARNVTASGYHSAIRHKGTVVAGASVTEYVSDKIYKLFDSPKRSLNLPIEETPVFEDKNLDNWTKFVPKWYGDTEALQEALNSGKATVYFPFGAYFSHDKKVIKVPASVRRIVGFSSVINGGGIVFRVEQNSDKPLIIEQFGYGVAVEHASPRTVVIKNGGYEYKDFPKSGKLFLEDVGISLRINYPHQVWARQLNVESLDAARIKIKNKGGTLWILGLKTEGKGAVINTTNGGKTEVLGTLIYPVQEFNAIEKKEAAFISNNSSQSLIYSVSAYEKIRNYDIQVEETRNGVKRQLLTKDFSGRMPLFVGYK